MADENNNNQLASTTGHEDEKISVEGLKSALQKFKTNLLDAGLAGKVATSTYNALVTRVEAIEALMGDATTPDSDNIINKVREMIAFFVNIAETDTLTGLLTNLETRVREQYAYVTTLNAAPTSSTLTYTIGSGASAVTYNYKVGDEVRVLDSQRGTTGSHSYIYYKLYDLVTVDNVTTAYWDLVGGGMSAGDGIEIDNNEISVDESVVRKDTVTEPVILPDFAVGTYLGTCETAADTAAKTASIAGYELQRKSEIVLTFTNGNTASNPTLNVNSKGAKAIYFKGAALASDVVKAGDIVTLVYNGTQFVVTNIETGNVVRSGFSLSTDETTGTDIFTPLGVATITHDDTTGGDSFDF